jgi:FtsP/CotA-like multicopper oxidase with cupredoxin domain
LPEWSEYRPDFFTMNGRVYPDTLAPNGLGNDVDGNLIPPPGRPELVHQPVSSLVQANSGDRVLLRFINLGFQQQTMALAGIKMKVIAKDATLLQGRTGEDLSYLTNTVTIGPGESADALFVAPDVAEQTTFLLYNRNYNRLHNGGGLGYGGQMTQVRMFPTGTIPAQTEPNT